MRQVQSLAYCDEKLIQWLTKGFLKNKWRKRNPFYSAISFQQKGENWENNKLWRSRQVDAVKTKGFCSATTFPNSWQKYHLRRITKFFLFSIVLPLSTSRALLVLVCSYRWTATNNLSSFLLVVGRPKSIKYEWTRRHVFVAFFFFWITFLPRNFSTFLLYLVPVTVAAWIHNVTVIRNSGNSRRPLKSIRVTFEREID